jgi:hypothetical protein
VTEESERVLRQRAEQIANLARLPAFNVLIEETEKRRIRDRQLLSRMLDADTPAVALQRQADYNRGFSEGMRYVTIQMPDGAARRLERAEMKEPESEEVDYWEVTRG